MEGVTTPIKQDKDAPKSSSMDPPPSGGDPAETGNKHAEDVAMKEPENEKASSPSKQEATEEPPDPPEIHKQATQEEAADGNNNDDDDEGEENEEEKDALPMLGGVAEKKAYCLLDGIFEKGGERSRITIPLTRLPAVLGRSHSTGDINFFSLGPAKALSRQHCVIDYRDESGGKLTTPKSALRDSSEEETLEYEKGQPFKVVNASGSGASSAFVLEALGKNLIMVGKQRIRQGEVAVLTSGTPIKMSGYSLYFLMPTDTSNPPKTMDLPLTESTNKSSPAKKSGAKRKMPTSSSSPQDHAKPKAKKPKAAPFAQLQTELDALPVDTLLERMDEAVNSERWERKHQLLGSTISLHAVNDATRAPEIRELAKDGGVPRVDIMRWIRESPKYGPWVEQMNSKMEAKSYQNTITKALLKAGNVRTGTGGRYIKWILPDVKLNPKSESPKDPPSEKAAEREQQEGNDDKENDEEEDDDEGAEGEDEEERERNDVEDEGDDNEPDSDGDGGEEEDAGEEGADGGEEQGDQPQEGDHDEGLAEGGDE